MERSITKERLFVFLVLAVITGLLYANSLKNGFFFDDYTELTENTLVQHPENIVLRPSEAFQSFSQDIIHFRPVPLVYRAVLYRAAGPNPFYYHLTNAILFLLFIYLIYVLSVLLTADHWVSLVAAVLYAVHPQNTTPVNFIIAHDALFEGIFCALMAIFFIRYLKHRKPQDRIISVLCYVLAVGSHDMAVFSFLFLMLLARLKYQKDWKTVCQLAVPYVLSALAYFSIKFLIAFETMTVFKDVGTGGQVNIIHAFFAALRLIGWYIAELIVPVKFVFIWCLSADPFHVVWKGAAVLILMVMALFLIARNNSLKSVSLLWFLLGFLPVPAAMFAYRASVGLIIDPVWFIFSSIGFFLYLGLVLGAKSGLRANILRVCSIFLLTAYWGQWTIRYNETWRTGLNYARYWLTISPENAYALRYTGQEYLRNGDPGQAVFYFKKVLEQGEHYALYRDLGTSYIMMGKPQEAYGYFMKALSLNPKDSYCLYSIGVIDDNQNRLKEAERYYTLAIQSSPHDDKLQIRILGKLIICYYKERKYKEFRESFNLFVFNNPSPFVLLGLVKSALELKDIGLAVEFSKECIRLYPDTFGVYLIDGEIFAEYKKSAEAVKVWQNGLYEFPGNVRLQQLIQKNSGPHE